MAEVVPRWEWRTWDKDIKLNINLKDYEHTRHVESSEVYMLSTECNKNSKVRENKMDIKSLQEVNDDALEQWKPIKKAAFPLPGKELEELYEIFRIPSPVLDKERYSFADFLELAKKEIGRKNYNRPREKTDGNRQELPVFFPYFVITPPILSI